MTLIDDRAAAGAAAFDRYVPAWALLVDLRRLDMSSTGTCVATMVFGSFDAARRRLRITSEEAAVRLGLDIGHWENPAKYADLTAAWRREVEKRLRT